jgi:hypothetical protein
MDNQKISKEFGVAMMEAFVAYDDEDYGRAVELANSVRYQLHQMGGSNAQVNKFTPSQSVLRITEIDTDSPYFGVKCSSIFRRQEIHF